MSWKRQSLLHHGIQHTMDLMRSSFLDEKTGLVLPVIRCTFDIPSFTPYLYPPTHPPTQNSKSSMIWWLNSLIFRIIYEVYFKHHVLCNCSLHGHPVLWKMKDNNWGYHVTMFRFCNCQVTVFIFWIPTYTRNRACSGWYSQESCWKGEEQFSNFKIPGHKQD